MVRVLVVDDSSVVRELLTFILNSDPDIEVVRAVGDGQAALDVIPSLRPDVITMDIHMPGMNGYHTTRTIMETCPTPIVVVSGSSGADDMDKTFRALEAGALVVVGRPPGLGHPGFLEAAAQLVQTVKSMAEVRVVRRWPRRPGDATTVPLRADVSAVAHRVVRVVIIGASTGGPVALQALLNALPRAFPVPILIVQHIAPGFVQGFCEWLSHSTERPVLVAAHGARMLPEHVYVAPDGHHMGVDADHRITISPRQSEGGLCPSVAHLFQSAAAVYGKHAAAVLLTGMGKDGAAELKLLKNAGAATFAQDEETAVIHGMPGEAIRLEAAMYIMPVERIAATLAAMVAGHRG